MTVPLCLCCGVALRKHPVKHLVFYTSDEAPKRPEDVLVGEYALRSIFSVKRHASGSIASIALWDGKSFGYQGNGFFCSLRCGYVYAVTVAQGNS